MEINLTTIITYTLGFLSQVLFFGRTIIQWFQSEKAGKVLSPILFWQLSLIASIFLLTYGILRKDFVIILGQVFTYFIYIRNLYLKGAWQKFGLTFKIFALVLPFVCFGWMVSSGNYSLKAIYTNEEIARWLLYFGIASQIIFPFRFIYQWIVAEKSKESTLPPGFWYISLVGGSMTVFYAILRRDPVLFIGNFGGLVMYTRNLFLHYTGKGLFDLLPFDLGVVMKRLKRKSDA